MSLYVDSSALLKRYLDEPDSETFAAILTGDRDVVTVRLTLVEARRALARVLSGSDLERVQARFDRDWARICVLVVDVALCERAAVLAGTTGVRTLDALQLAAYEPVATQATLVTADRRQAAAARARA